MITLLSRLQYVDMLRETPCDKLQPYLIRSRSPLNAAQIKYLLNGKGAIFF